MTTKSTSGAAVPTGTVFVRWADYDPAYKGRNRLAIYGTKADQRANRPDLQPFRVLITRLEKCTTTNTRRLLPAGVATSKIGQLGRSSAGSQPMAHTSRTTPSAKVGAGANRARSFSLNK